MRFCFCFFSLFFFSLWCSYDLHLDYEYATFSAVPIYNFTDYFVPIHTCLTRSLFMCDQLKQKGTYERPIWASPSSNRTPLTNCDVFFSLFFLCFVVVAFTCLHQHLVKHQASSQHCVASCALCVPQTKTMASLRIITNRGCKAALWFSF